MKNKLVAITIIFAFYSSNAQVINIPADYSTIQDGIDNSNNGDTIIVAPGEYFENINFRGKSIFLSSTYLFDHDTSLISKTVINGSNKQASVVTLNSNEDTTSVLNGFTITGGKGNYNQQWEAYAGGGICIDGGGKIINNHIVNNSINKSNNFAVGGGIYINTGASPTEDQAKVIIRNNIVEKNTVIGIPPSSGGGISTEGAGHICISGNVIRSNTLTVADPFDDIVGGGGLSVIAPPDISIPANSPIVVNNIIAENKAPNGGGIFAMGYIEGYGLRLVNNTIADNFATYHGGAVYLYNGHCTAINNIFWNNDAAADPGIYYRGELNITYSITQDIHPGEGNLTVDPQFIDTDYHLADQSKAIDAGSPEVMFNDYEDPENAGIPLPPAKGTLAGDMGAYGGNDRINLDKEDYQVEECFLYQQFDNLNYRIAYPQDYDKTKSYPLTIVYHGSALWGTDNESQLFVGLPWRINALHYGYNEFTLVPQAPISPGWNDNKTLETSFQLINGLIDSLNIDTTKVVLTGWSQGGGATWNLLNRYPHFFAAGIPVSGTNKGFGDIKHMPVWIHHGRRDANVSNFVAWEYIDLFEETGLEAVLTENLTDEEIIEAINRNERLFYSEYPSAKHHIVYHSYDNAFMFDWLKKCSRPLIRPINCTAEKYNGDTLVITTSYENFGAFSFDHGLIVEDFEKNQIDSLPLYDDGEHGDNEEQDGIWGNYFKIDPDIKNYRFGIKIRNHYNEKEFYHHDLARYTIPASIENVEVSGPVGLYPNYPNPFVASTTIKYQVSERTEIELYISNLLGQKVATLVEEMKYPGIYTVVWNASKFAVGVYICTLNVGNKLENRKMFKVH